MYTSVVVNLFIIHSLMLNIPTFAQIIKIYKMFSLKCFTYKKYSTRIICIYFCRLMNDKVEMIIIKTYYKSFHIVF